MIRSSFMFSHTWKQLVLFFRVVRHYTFTKLATKYTKEKGERVVRTKISMILVFVLVSLLVSAPLAQASTILKYGSSGSEVQALQVDLKQLGYDPGPADGIFGSRTKAAVQAFQTKMNLKPDGMVGPLTSGALVRAQKTQGILSTAKSLLRVPYQWGGSTTSGFDCSGYTQYVFAAHGISLPRVSRDQYKIGTSVEFSQLQAGDLVFFTFTASREISHVGIYLGNNQFISATTSKGVTIYSFNPYWTNAYIGAKRMY